MLKLLVRHGEGKKFKWCYLVDTKTNKYKYLNDEVNDEGTFMFGCTFDKEFFREISLKELPEECKNKLTNLEYMQLAEKMKRRKK